MIDLALASGIAPSVWAAEGAQAIVTAYELRDKKNTQAEADEENWPQPAAADDGR